MKQSFVFVQLGSLYICLPIGLRSVVLELCTLLLVLLFFSFLQKVSGQQILERCMKDFVLGFVAHIHALAKIQVQKIYLAWIPKCLPSFYYFFLREKIGKRDFFTAHHFVKMVLCHLYATLTQPHLSFSKKMVNS